MSVIFTSEMVETEKRELLRKAMIGQVRARAPEPLPDTGGRSEFDTGAVRDSMLGRGLPSEIPVCSLMEVSVRFEEGAVKYSRGNWRKGIPISRYLDAIARHSWAVALGKTDENHPAAISWNALCMSWTLRQIEAGALPKELDDRPFAAASR